MKTDGAGVSLDAEEIRKFWEQRARRYQDEELVNASNLESDAELARQKHRQEQAVLMDYVRPQPGQVLLDLGAGHCAWSVTFARIVEAVDAVEYSEGMVELARRHIQAEGAGNVTIHQGPAQEYRPSRTYDTVLLSGLTIYLNDAELSQLLANIRTYLKDGGRVVLRDGTAKEDPFTINNRYSEELDANYSAHYRTAAQYIDWFAHHGLTIRRHQDMFEAGSPLNKRKETILRIYEFAKDASP
jgi:cyclopropane fatty-acyl-phospholipid synthase-like methyltransferase